MEPLNPEKGSKTRPAFDVVFPTVSRPPPSKTDRLGPPEDAVPPSPGQQFVSGILDTPAGPVPIVVPQKEAADFRGTFRARWGVGRMRYAVDPGLYALRKPTEDSPVLVTANYKMSFDRLRFSLQGRSAWILVLDTKGINVWCAAGKGTFSTEELVRRVDFCAVDKVVTHRRLILPQLAGPGVAAYRVKKLCGFEVVYGPIRAEDLPEFLDAGMKVVPRMRHKTFPIAERVVLIPVELVEAFKWAVFILPALFLLGGLGGPGSFPENALIHGSFAVAAASLGILAGAVLTPTLLPWLPGRAFSMKGAVAGCLTSIPLFAYYALQGLSGARSLEILSWLVLIPAIASFLGMNFTGASTYTSLSGVKKEMRIAVPIQIVSAALGLAGWLISRFLA